MIGWIIQGVGRGTHRSTTYPVYGARQGGLAPCVPLEATGLVCCRGVRAGILAELAVWKQAL